MAKSEWGTKRTGPCGTKFYDFNKRPIICPNCGGKVNTIEEIAKVVKKEKTVPKSSTQNNNVENNEDDISVLLDDEMENIDNQKNNELQDVIDEENELEEITTTADVDGYSTPFAFSKKKDSKK